MLYDNVQFVLLLSRYLKINPQENYLSKLEQTIEFIEQNFVNSEGFLGSAYDADSEGEEGKYYVYNYEEVKDFENIEKYFDIKKEGNWENKIILVEKETPTKKIINQLLDLRSKRKKPFFDDKTQLDLNCLWVSSLIAAHDLLPNKGYLKLAENYFLKIEKKYFQDKIYHSYSKDTVFIEDYAYLINALNDLAEKTMNFKYKNLAKKMSVEAVEKFYIDEKIFFKKV